MSGWWARLVSVAIGAVGIVSGPWRVRRQRPRRLHRGRTSRQRPVAPILASATRPPGKTQPVLVVSSEGRRPIVVVIALALAAIVALWSWRSYENATAAPGHVSPTRERISLLVDDPQVEARLDVQADDGTLQGHNQLYTVRPQQTVSAGHVARWLLLIQSPTMPERPREPIDPLRIDDLEIDLAAAMTLASPGDLLADGVGYHSRS